MVKSPKNLLPNLLNFTLEEMEEFISSSGKEKYRARQIMKWLHQSGSLSFDDMTTLSSDFRKKLAAIARIQRPEIVKILTSQDGTKKALLRLDDGLFIESVLIPGKATGQYAYPRKPVALWVVSFVLPPRRGSRETYCLQKLQDSLSRSNTKRRKASTLKILS